MDTCPPKSVQSTGTRFTRPPSSYHRSTGHGEALRGCSKTHLNHSEVAADDFVPFLAVIDLPSVGLAHRDKGSSVIG